MWTAAGIALVGGGVVVSAYVAEVNTRNDIERAIPPASVRGCGAATAPFTAACAAFRDADDSIKTAQVVKISALYISGGLVAGAITGALVQEVGRTSVQVAPTVGGVMVRGTF
jgi:hypothetical protein